MSRPAEVMSGPSVEFDRTILCHDLATALQDTDLNVEICRRLSGRDGMRRR
jgi:hypothetical protein